MNVRRLLYGLPAVVWFIFLLILSFLPGKSFPSVTLLEWDKLAHLLLYAIWMMLIRFSMDGGERKLKWGMFAALVGTGLVGIAIEFGQEHLTADRHFDVYDIVANVSGSFLAWIWIALRR